MALEDENVDTVRLGEQEARLTKNWYHLLRDLSQKPLCSCEVNHR